MDQRLLSSKFKFADYTFSCSKRYNDARNGIDMHFLAYMEEGTSKFVTDTQVMEISQGDVFYLPMGLCYESHWHSDGAIRWRSYGFAVFPEAEERGFIMQKLPSSPEILDKVLKIPTQNPPDSNALLRLYDALSAVLPHMQRAPVSREREITEKAKKYLRSHTQCTITKLAEHCCVSQSTLYAAFQKELGTTPNEVRQQLQCQKAVQLLTSTDRSVQDISDSLHFSSPSYFRKILRKHTGQTPRQIRKKSTSV